jgi:hypothetical protein
MSLCLPQTRWLPVALAAALAGSTAPAAERIAPVTGAHRDPAALARRIDQALGQALAAEKVPAAPLADDAEFLRRACLDITGVIPGADRAAAFLESTDPNKRAKLIDELLASPQYARHMADIWQALLVQRDPDNRRIQFNALESWLEERFKKNQPWDRLVKDLLTATGTQEENGAVTFYLANATPDKLTDHVSRVFMGVRLQCAQCHNHPFTHWKQTEYWGMAAFFEKVRANGNVNQMVKAGESPGINESSRGRPLKLPDSAKKVPPKFFLGAEPKVTANEPYRPVLAAWLCSADNPYFAKAMVNRLWGQFFGRGFANPVDDLRDDNPISHPELLRDLAAAFAEDGFDIKNAIRAICNSEAYQRTSKASADAGDADARLFARMAIKPLTPEQLFDSLEQVLGKQEGRVERVRGAQRYGPNTPRSAFVNFFAVDETADPTEYQAGIPQALRLMNAPQMNRTVTALRQADQPGNKPAQVVEHLYLATLSRRPTAAESGVLLAYVDKHGSRPRDAYGDILWALLNSSEFTLNH